MSLRMLLVLVFATFQIDGAMSQTYPERPIKIIVGFTASPPDTIARLIGQQLSTQMGQPFVIENRTGANGIIGADAVAKAAPDGYTLLVTSASYAVNPSITKKLPFDPIEDLIPIANIAQNDGLILVVTPSLPVQTVQELISYSKRPDVKLSYASPGVGNTLHLAGALFNQLADLRAVHVTYRGAAPAITDLMAGQVQFMFLPPPAAAEYISQGKLKALAYTDKKRLTAFPNVPTMSEAGLDKFDFGEAGWYGLFAPAKTPPAIIEQLSRETQAAVKSAAIQQRFAALGFEPVGDRPAAFQKTLNGSIARFSGIVRLIGLEPQ